jgi:hypothetical protein
MTTVKITIDDSLPFSKLKSALSLFRGVTKVEISESSFIKTEKDEYEELKNIFFNSSKYSMSKQLDKYL